MVVTDVEESMESRQEDDGSPGWRESFHFDFWDDELRIGGFARITLLPAERTVWYWSAVVQPGEDLIAVVDSELDFPKLAASLESRGQGLWVDHICETPLEHWSVGSEAFALRVDAPGDMLGDALGALVPIGFDLEWEAAEPARMTPEPDAGGPFRYHQRCGVHGELLVGDRVLDITGRGSRNHRWGSEPSGGNSVAVAEFVPLAADQAVVAELGSADTDWWWWAVEHIAGGSPPAPAALGALGVGDLADVALLWAPVAGPQAAGAGRYPGPHAYAFVAHPTHPGWLEVVGGDPE